MLDEQSKRIQHEKKVEKMLDECWMSRVNGSNMKNKRVTLSELRIIGIWDMADHTLWVECMLAPNTVG